MHKSVWVPLFSLVAALAGCSTADTKPSDLDALRTAPTAEEVSRAAHGAPNYRLDYLAGGRTFLYETFRSSEGRYYGLLFQDGTLVAVDSIDSELLVWPKLRSCTVFPADPAQDVDACFRGFNQAAVASAIKLTGVISADQSIKADQPGELSRALVATAYVGVQAPVAALVALPLIGVAAFEHRNAEGKPVTVTLDEPYADVRDSVEAYPPKFLSIADGKGTVLVPGSGLSEVSSAFGVADGKIIWIDLLPRAGCGAGLLSEGTRCFMRATRETPHQPVPSKPRAPVMDDWENLAVFETAPPQFEVLGETQGEAKGFTAKGRMADAVEEMKKQAREDGATAVLVYPVDYPPDQDLPASPPPAAGTPIYGDWGEVPQFVHRVRGLEIYVPADAAAFRKAMLQHASQCDDLSKQKDAAKAARDAAEDSGTPDDVAAAKAKLQSVEDAQDAAFCGDDDWYAEQMTAQKH